MIRISVLYGLMQVVGIMVAFGVAELVGLILPVLVIPAFIALSAWWLWIEGMTAVEKE